MSEMDFINIRSFAEKALRNAIDVIGYELEDEAKARVADVISNVDGIITLCNSFINEKD